MSYTLSFLAAGSTHTHTHTHWCTVVVVHSLSGVSSLQPHGLQHTRWIVSFTISRNLLKFKSIESVMLTISFSVTPFFPPSILPSIRVFSNESDLHIGWPKYWSFTFSINPSNEYSGFISFRIEWFDLLAVQGTLKSLLQHHSWKASILWRSAFFMVQLSHPSLTSIHDYWKNHSFEHMGLRQQSNISAFLICYLGLS